jgi:predicted nucleotidyltransferase
VDILIELDPTHPIGVFAYASLQRYIQDLLGEATDIAAIPANGLVVLYAYIIGAIS